MATRTTIDVLLPGHVVKFRGRVKNFGANQLFVVISINAKTVSAAPLGGSEQYIRAPHGAFKIVNGEFKVTK